MLINEPKRLGLSFISLTMIVTAVAITSVTAQTYPTEPLTWGVKAGINTSDFLGKDAANSEIQEDFSGGILLNYRFNDYWALQPEFIFNRKGADLDRGLTGENGPARYEFGYINIPVLVKYYIPSGMRFSPNLYAGPEAGFKLYGESNGSDINRDLNNTEFGVAFGVELDFSLGSDPTNLIRTVGLDFRYSLGLTEIFDTPQKPEARNGVFFAALFIGF